MKSLGFTLKGKLPQYSEFGSKMKSLFTKQVTPLSKLRPFWTNVQTPHSLDTAAYKAKLSYLATAMVPKQCFSTEQPRPEGVSGKSKQASKQENTLNFRLHRKVTGH